MKTIDAHIHLDLYPVAERQLILDELTFFAVQSVIAVSMNLNSCMANLELQRLHPEQVLAAFGFHPEQDLPADEQLEQLFAWIILHQAKMVAVGEVGLPYYNRLEAEEQGLVFDLKPYLALLERFIALAADLGKPIILHAVYEDADLVCDLLEKYKVSQAHFHWFKGSRETVERMIDKGYFISFTPDILYEQEIQQLAAIYPITQMMVETDGPWPFEGPFSGQTTHPRMLAENIHKLAEIKELDPEEAGEIIRQNTIAFYRIKVEK
ncbi:TatD family deoxyribonuclease [Paenibacillus psychroresistens]|uniref:TatD family deoxyribonuclease n=1 Tax=Paenibacillus psychroresistens TaxID=1778678 RepID=A0A6B8RIE1_9BACL|nr:TatD family hydrolase [Paenibacillus psychroresistens]QGQ95504.1 TatD family deoxyribonuclease [Paenibacillus psychroresistens]